jgi:tryptophan synthase alpha chain
MSTAAPGSATRFDAAFAARTGDRPGIIAYVTAGFPERDSTADLLLAAERAGCIAAEVGIPFSDPLADGPVIQRTSWAALGNGMTVARALGQVADARGRGLTIPCAVMTYINPVLSHGLNRFAADAARSGVDGGIFPDLPAGEAADVAAAFAAAGLAHIPLVAPTTPTDRIASLVAHASGFVYCVSIAGITGARDVVAPEALDVLERVRAVTPLPRGLGFGISQPEHLTRLAGRCEAVVVGSALMLAVEAGPADPAGAAAAFLSGLGA